MIPRHEERESAELTGSLRTYLGIAPGVGKTYAMLAEGRRRADAGERVVVAWIERHGRADTRAQLGDLEVIAPRTVAYRASTFEELDVQAVIASGADLVLVDELAHSVPDTKRGRWEDVADLLAAGLDVLTSTNVANLRSVRDYAARITGAGAVESVPDEFVRSGEVILIDLPAEVLRRRIASGKVYSADQVGGALTVYFQASNLDALSELGRSWVAGEVETIGADLLAKRGLSQPVSPKLVLAGVSGSPRSEQVIRTAAEFAREDDADLVVIHVNAAEGLSARRHEELERDRKLVVELGGSFDELEGSAPARVLSDAARARGASRVVVARKRSRLGKSARWSLATRLRHLLPEVTVDEI
jgi:two-component system, OmpR family, sensor histidine kinase KdpD